VSVAHACNSSYSGGRDKEDRSLKPAWENRNPSQKGPGGVAQDVGPESKPQYRKTNKQTNKQKTSYN
jgi:hypothetical protein